MKKIFILITIIIIIIVGYKLIPTHKNDYRPHRETSSSYKDKYHPYYKTKHYKDSSHSSRDDSNNSYNDYTEVNGIPFNKGYNGDYNKSAVEQANKEHSKVTLNNDFTVKGVSSINGMDAIYKRDIDGDTLVVTPVGSAKDITIRFASMDTAEDVNPKIKVIEPYSVQGADFVKSKLTQGEKIKVVTDGSTGKYGRTVGYIYYNSNGKWYNLNEELVSNGLARIAYVPKKDLNTPIIKSFYRAEDSAKEQHLNIWSIKGYATKLGYNLAIFK